MTVVIDGESLSLEQVVRVARSERAGVDLGGSDRADASEPAQG